MLFIYLFKNKLAITYWLGEILGRQKKNDFSPRVEEVLMMSNGTAVITNIYIYVFYNYCSEFIEYTYIYTIIYIIAMRE